MDHLVKPGFPSVFRRASMYFMIMQLIKRQCAMGEYIRPPSNKRDKRNLTTEIFISIWMSLLIDVVGVWLTRYILHVIVDFE